MTGFSAPNYTQTPNDLFDIYLPDLGDAEIRVLLAFIRNTLGWKRTRVVLSLRTIGKITGLSENGVKAGTDAAVKRGLVKRLPKRTRTSPAHWELVINPLPQSVREENDPTTSLSEVDLPHSVRDLKERKKRSSSSSSAAPEKILEFYEQEITKPSPTIREKLMIAKETYTEIWVLDAIQEAAISSSHPNLKYIEAILRRWKQDGRNNNTKGVNHGNRKNGRGDPRHPKRPEPTPEERERLRAIARTLLDREKQHKDL